MVDAVNSVICHCVTRIGNTDSVDHKLTSPCLLPAFCFQHLSTRLQFSVLQLVLRAFAFPHSNA